MTKSARSPRRRGSRRWRCCPPAVMDGIVTVDDGAQVQWPSGTRDPRRAGARRCHAPGMQESARPQRVAPEVVGWRWWCRGEEKVSPSRARLPSLVAGVTFHHHLAPEVRAGRRALRDTGPACHHRPAGVPAKVLLSPELRHRIVFPSTMAPAEPRRPAGPGAHGLVEHLARVQRRALRREPAPGSPCPLRVVSWEK